MWSLDLLLTIVQLHYNVISSNKTMDLGFIMLNITVDINFILITECKDIKADTIIMFFILITGELALNWRLWTPTLYWNKDRSGKVQNAGFKFGAKCYKLYLHGAPSMHHPQTRITVQLVYLCLCTPVKLQFQSMSLQTHNI